MEGIRERAAPSQPGEGVCCVTSPNDACVRDYGGGGGVGGLKTPI